VKAHLLVFDSSQITRELVVEKIDHMSVVENWAAFFDNAICLASQKDARSLSRLLHIEFPELRFIITEIELLSKGGWLPPSIWAFLNHPEPADTAADA
jgi:hypothetical protein